MLVIEAALVPLTESSEDVSDQVSVSSLYLGGGNCEVGVMKLPVESVVIKKLEEGGIKGTFTKGYNEERPDSRVGFKIYVILIQNIYLTTLLRKPR